MVNTGNSQNKIEEMKVVTAVRINIEGIMNDIGVQEHNKPVVREYANDLLTSIEDMPESELKIMIGSFEDGLKTGLELCQKN
jgi:hypothetical protein